MDDKAEIRIKIAQNETDQRRLKTEAESLQEQLAACAKPELRHLDYGLDIHGNPCLTVRLSDRSFKCSSTNYVFDNAENAESECAGPAWRLKTKLGNLADDLARNAEPLKEFEVDGSIFRITAGTCISVKTWPSASDKYYSKDEATEIHQKLGQLIATARKAADNS